MDINGILQAVLLIFLVYICVYTLVDRVCNCIEHCSLMKNAKEYSEKIGEKEKDFD